MRELLGRWLGLEAKASAAGGAISAMGLGLPAWTPRDYLNFAEEGYRKNAVAYRCIKMISAGAAGVPWLLYGRDGAEVDAHPLLDLLARPQPLAGGSAVFEALFAYLLISGNSYLEAVGPNNRPPRELWNLRPDRTRVIVGPNGIPGGYEYEANGQKFRWQADGITGLGPICHFREFNPTDDWYGLPRIDPAAYGIDRHNSASAHNKALLDNGATPKGALVFQPVSGGPQAPAQSTPMAVLEAAEERLTSRHGGPDNAGRPLVLGGNVKWEGMGFSPKDMDYTMGKEDSARDICVAFGVPHILIVPGAATYNNVREAKLELWESTILPLIDMVVDQLNIWLTPRFGDGLRLAVDLDEISALEHRRETKRKSVLDLRVAGVITREEAREALQYEPETDGIIQPDAAIINALLAGVPTMGLEPLLRYLKSVGLVDANATDADIMAAAEAFAPDDEDEDAALAIGDEDEVP